MDANKSVLDILSEFSSRKSSQWVLERLDGARGMADKSFAGAVIALVAEEDHSATQCLASLVPLLKDRIKLIDEIVWSIFLYCYHRQTDSYQRQTFADILDTLHDLHPACIQALTRDFLLRSVAVLDQRKSFEAGLDVLTMTEKLSETFRSNFSELLSSLSPLEVSTRSSLVLLASNILQPHDVVCVATKVLSSDEAAAVRLKAVKILRVISLRKKTLRDQICDVIKISLCGDPSSAVRQLCLKTISEIAQPSQATQLCLKRTHDVDPGVRKLAWNRLRCLLEPSDAGNEALLDALKASLLSSEETKTVLDEVAGMIVHLLTISDEPWRVLSRIGTESMSTTLKLNLQEQIDVILGSKMERMFL